MVIIKALALWMFIVGLGWIFVEVWVYLTMSGIAELVNPSLLPLQFTIAFTPPGLLIVGSTLLMAPLYPRVGSILVALPSALLTFVLVSAIIGLLRYQPQPLEARIPVWPVVGCFATIVVVTDAAAVMLIRRTFKPNARANRWLL